MDFRQQLASSSSNPQKMLKIVISISVVMLLIWLFVVARMDYTAPPKPQQSQSARQVQVDSLRSVLGRSSDIGRSVEGGSSGIFMNAFTTFLVLIAALGGVWFWARKKAPTQSPTGSREIGSHTIGQGSELKFVEINEEIWILSVTADGIDLLHRYPRSEWKEPADVQKPAAATEGFYELFKNSKG